MDKEFRLERQIGPVVKTIFFHLQQLAEVKPFLS